MALRISISSRVVSTLSINVVEQEAGFSQRLEYLTACRLFADYRDDKSRPSDEDIITYHQVDPGNLCGLETP